MRILSIDTATEAASVAVVEEGKLLGEISFNFGKQHSVVLLSTIDHLLKSINVDIDSIDGYAASKGPGSFTGLRIGMATIKGLCFAQNKPFVSISTLDSLAYNMAYTSGVICPIMDALRNNVYTALYKFEKDELVKISDYKVVSIDELISSLKEYDSICFIGDGLSKFQQKLNDSMENAVFAPTHLNFARASALGELGLKLLLDGDSEDLNTSTPIYLRKSQAEREYDKKMGLASDE